jgi:putative flippase GtrA
MKRPLAAVFSSQFFRFVVSGGLAAVVNILSRIALSQLTSYSVAIVIAYLIGMTTAYVLMKLLVFERSGRRAAEEYLRFGVVNLVALAQVWGVSMLFAFCIFPWLMPTVPAMTPAHVIGVLSPIVTSYVLHKHFTFRRIS